MRGGSLTILKTKVAYLRLFDFFPGQEPKRCEEKYLECVEKYKVAPAYLRRWQAHEISDQLHMI
jgi:hypothetical protein